MKAAGQIKTPVFGISFRRLMEEQIRFCPQTKKSLADPNYGNNKVNESEKWRF
jgi:hypothetical protein